MGIVLLVFFQYLCLHFFVTLVYNNIFLKWVGWVGYAHSSCLVLTDCTECCFQFFFNFDEYLYLCLFESVSLIAQFCFFSFTQSDNLQFLIVAFILLTCNVIQLVEFILSLQLFIVLCLVSFFHLFFFYCVILPWCEPCGLCFSGSIFLASSSLKYSFAGYTILDSAPFSAAIVLFFWLSASLGPGKSALSCFFPLLCDAVTC